MRKKLIPFLAALLATAGLRAQGILQNENTVVIAGSNSAEADKKRADFVCTGHNDERVIQKAVDRLTDRRVLAKRGGTATITSIPSTMRTRTDE